MSSSDSSGGSTTAYAAGVCISIGCSVFNSTGMGLQKRVHLRLASLPPAERTYWRERGWAVGVCFMAIASLLSLGNFALLGQSRASAMASLTIISNAVMSRFFLGESFTLVDLGVTGLIGSGIVVAVVFGSAGGGAPRTTLDQILVLLHRDVVYIATALIVVVFLAAELFVRRAEKAGPPARGAWGRVECVLRAFLAGLFSGSTGFLAKSVVVSVESMIADGSASDLARYEFWLLLAALPASIVMQLLHLNGGLRRFDAMDVVPVYQAFIVTVGVAWGWTFYAENEFLPAFNEAMFAVGCAISVLGIVLLSWRKRQEREEGSGADSYKPLMADSDVREAGGDARRQAGGDGGGGGAYLSTASTEARGGEEEEGERGRGGNFRTDRTTSFSITPGAFMLDAVDALAARDEDGDGDREGVGGVRR
jgi:hypothetical protein